MGHWALSLGSVNPAAEFAAVSLALSLGLVIPAAGFAAVSLSLSRMQCSMVHDCQGMDSIDGKGFQQTVSQFQMV